MINDADNDSTRVNLYVNGDIDIVYLVVSKSLEFLLNNLHEMTDLDLH